MNMLANLPPELLARTLSCTERDDVLNLLCASRATARYVKSFGDMVHPLNGLDKFMRELPVIEGIMNSCSECNVEALDMAAKTTRGIKHEIRGKGAIHLTREHSQYVSIRCPRDMHLVEVVAGSSILRFDRVLMQLFDEDDGCFDIMAFLRHLPSVVWHDIIIKFDTGGERMLLKTSLRPLIAFAFVNLVRWRFLNIGLAGDGYCFHELSCAIRLWSNHISLGHIVACEGGDNAVQAFTLIINQVPQHALAASSAWINAVPDHLFNCPVKLRNCYYLPFMLKLNCSVVDKLELRMKFRRAFTGWVRVWNVHEDFLTATHSMYAQALF